MNTGILQMFTSNFLMALFNSIKGYTNECKRKIRKMYYVGINVNPLSYVIIHSLQIYQLVVDTK